MCYLQFRLHQHHCPRECLVQCSTGEFGMVRNHLYDVTISAVQGLGTPVYDADKTITPEKPEEDQFSYIAAKINVLAWRVVSQEVTLQ